MFMQKAPEVVAAPNYPLDCTTSNAAPILDVICSSYFVINGVYILAQKDCATANIGETCFSSGQKAGGALLSGGLAALCGISAASGFGYADRCHKMKDLNALCITGDEGACQQLRPGWVPGARPSMQQGQQPRQPPPPPPPN